MRLWLPVLAGALLAGCGYPGEPLPPALNRPARVTDLSVLERGAKIYAAFTMPLKTTEDLPVVGQPDIEIRVGPIGERFDQNVWEQGADRIPVEDVKVAAGRVEAQVPAAKYYGKTVVVGVRLHGPHGRDVGWSVDVLNILPELPTPENVTAKDAAGGVIIDWKVARPAAEFRIFRKLTADKQWTLAGTSDKPGFLDTGVEYGKDYEYFVQSDEKTGAKYSESEVSAIVAIRPADRFAPAPPVGLTAVPATKSIELVWDSSRETDLAFYRVYRDNSKIADSVASPSYSDRAAIAGAKHTYRVTAVDTAGNESEPSAAVESTLP